VAVDSGPLGYGRRVRGECSAMRPPALLRDRTDFLVAAVYVILSVVNVVPLRPTVFALVVLGTAALACLAELPLGRYAGRS